tara:strand:- start:596 stop:814 length:219 start_codon:yes stop_codon:yes gene_type:complete
MQRINHNIDRYINWNDPDSIDTYAPEDQFEYVPDEPTFKDHVIYFLRDYLTDPIKFFFIKRFKKTGKTMPWS